MYKLKKIIGIILSLSTLAASVPAFAYTDVAVDRSCYEAVMRLGDLGIVSGYEDGSFLPDNTITRAEFARIIVSAMNKETEAKSTGYISSFADVEGGLWSAPYINYVSSQEIVAGYSDGSFQPNKTISFAESLTIILRVLGYKEDSVGYFWPNNYVDAARSLGISEGLGYDAGTAITRGDAAIMIDRALFADLSGQTDKTLLEDTGYTLMKDMIVIDSGSSNSNLSTNEVRLSDSKTYTSKMSLPTVIGQYADYAVLDKNSNLVAMKVTGEGTNKAAYSMSVYVNGVTDSTISYVSNGKAGSYRFDSSFTVYNDGEKQTFSQAKGDIVAGKDMTFYGEANGIWSFAVVGGDDVDPVIAKRDYTANDNNLEGTQIASNGLVVYRDGKAATLDDIAVNDVVYYNTRSNVMDVYSKKVTGIYYDAQPSKSFVESVTVGGKSYEIGYDAAAHTLGANAGSFEIGERVTLLLGKEDKAVFAVELSDAVLENYGIVLSVGTQIAESGMNEGRSETYADIFMANGETYRTVTDSNYKDYIGKLVRITYENSKAKLTTQAKPSNVSGTLDTANRTLNGKNLMKDAVIIQRTAYVEESLASCKVLDIDTMSADKITESQLLNVVYGNSFGDIALIFVKDVESVDTFGIVSGTIKGTESSIAGYEIYSNGSEKSYNTSFTVAGLSVGMPVSCEFDNGSLESLKQLYKIKTGTVAAVDTSRVKLGDNIYQLAPDVQVIDISDVSAMSNLKTEDIAGRDVTVYSDTSASSECVIRIITIK